MFAWYWSLPFAVLLLMLTTAVYSIFIHRACAHKSVIFTSTALINFCRFWWWLMGFWYPNWVQHMSAMHRKHHIRTDTAEDPHSPYVYSLAQLLFVFHNPGPGQPYYMKAEEVQKLASDLPTYNDWAEQHVYSQYYKYTFFILVALFFLLFGFWGMMCSIPLLIGIRLTARMHNYLSHKVGYRHGPPLKETDHSKNLFPIGFLLSGEELHANHHNSPGSARLSTRWWEFDFGWTIILILRFFGLIKLSSKK